MNLPEVAMNASIRISMKIPQCLLPAIIDTNGETLTELFVYMSDDDFDEFIVYFFASVDIFH